MKKKSSMQATTLNELIFEKIYTAKVENRIGTAYNYRTLRNVIERKFGFIPISQINEKWALQFHTELKNEGKSNATIKNYFAMIQCVMNYASYKGLKKGNVKLTRSKPYELDKVKIEKPRKRNGNWLPREDMRKLFDYFKSLDSYYRTPKKWIGIFLASYLCNGANMADLVRMRYDAEYFNSNGKLLGFFRQKVINSSGAYIRVPITEQLRYIIDEIGDKEQKGGLIFGSFLENTDITDGEAMSKMVMFLNSYCSKVLKKIAPTIGIREDISFTFARHSYATNLNHAGGNYALIEKCLGHVLGGVADNYIGDAPIEKLFELNNMLL